MDIEAAEDVLAEIINERARERHAPAASAMRLGIGMRCGCLECDERMRQDIERLVTAAMGSAEEDAVELRMIDMQTGRRIVEW